MVFCVCQFQALHQMGVWQTQLITIADAREEGHDKETGVPLLMALSRLFKSHTQPACMKPAWAR